MVTKISVIGTDLTVGYRGRPGKVHRGRSKPKSGRKPRKPSSGKRGSKAFPKCMKAELKGKKGSKAKFAAAARKCARKVKK